MLDKIRVIGFDMDNTLYVSTSEIQERVRGLIYKKISSEFSIPLEKAKDLFEEKYKEELSGSAAIELISKKFGKRIESDIIQESMEQSDFLDLIKENKQLNDMFFRLKKQRGIDLVTSSSYNLTLKKLERIGIDLKVFDYIFSNDNGLKKSTGDLYKEWINVRKLPSERLLYVGDNIRLDVDIPKTLGIKTCIVNENYNNADFQINNILDLEFLLQNFQS